MPPQRTIIVDHNAILVSISAQAAEQRADVLADRDDRERNPSYRQVRYTHEDETEELKLAGWVRRDLQSFAGRYLTPSERKRWQEAVREMEAKGLIETYNAEIRLTDAGQALANQLISNPAITANN